MTRASGGTGGSVYEQEKSRQRYFRAVLLRNPMAGSGDSRPGGPRRDCAPEELAFQICRGHGIFLKPGSPTPSGVLAVRRRSPRRLRHRRRTGIPETECRCFEQVRGNPRFVFREWRYAPGRLEDVTTTGLPELNVTMDLRSRRSRTRPLRRMGPLYGSRWTPASVRACFNDAVMSSEARAVVWRALSKVAGMAPIMRAGRSRGTVQGPLDPSGAHWRAIPDLRPRHRLQLPRSDSPLRRCPLILHRIRSSREVLLDDCQAV